MRMGAPLTAVVSGVLVLLLHLGLLLVEAGAVRRKNVASVFTRGLACLMVTVVLSWVCGFALAMSEGNPFVGTSTGYFGLHALPAASPSWFLATTVAAVPAALAAAPMAERTHLTGHLLVATVLAAVVLPVPAHWVWAADGWLAARGVTDAGGAMVVHGVGGMVGLVGCLLVGRRAERRLHPSAPLPGHSLPLVAVGGGLVLVGMVGKLVGLGVDLGEEGVEGVEERLATNVLLGGGMAAVLAMHVFKFQLRGRGG